MSEKAIPEGYHTVQPYLSVKGATELLAFLKTVFDARQTEFMPADDGTLMHAEVVIGDSVVMLSDARDPWPAMQAAMYVYVPDVDATYKKALDAGATSTMEPANQFYGDRQGGVKDKWGNYYWISTRVETLSKDEMHKRAEQYKSRSE